MPPKARDAGLARPARARSGPPRPIDPAFDELEEEYQTLERALRRLAAGSAPGTAEIAEYLMRRHARLQARIAHILAGLRRP